VRSGCWTSAVVLALLLAGGGCMNKRTIEALETTATLQTGTMSDLHARRGRGPFTTYDLPPAEMLGVLEQSARKARGLGGKPVSAIFVSENRLQVVAKERPPDEADDDGYAAAFRTAMLAIVHPVHGRKDACRVEIHSIGRGVFHPGVVAWQRDMPGWIDAVMKERRAQEAAPLKAVP